jgi:hypothetical protein
MREWTAMRTRRDIQTCNLAAEYRTRFAAPSSPEQKKQEQRKAEAAIVKAHQPEDFGLWRRQKNGRGCNRQFGHCTCRYATPRQRTAPIVSPAR